MRVFEITEWGIDNLKPNERDVPEINENQILVKMKAASLNFRDYLMIEGKYNPKQKLPLIPLSDGAGEVVETGSAVKGIKKGDRVAGQFAPRWVSGSPEHNELRTTLGGPLDGTLTEYRAFGAEEVVKVPDFLTYEEAATLPCAALTAWSSLVTYGNIKTGDTVLVLGTGGVSVFALQFARAAGAHVIATSSDDEKLARVKELGADEIINYKETPNWGSRVRKMTGLRGVDHIIEVGGASTLEQSLKAVRIDGTISLIGILGGSESSLNLLPIVMQNVKMQGIVVGSRKAFEDMNRAVEKHRIKPVVDKIFPFEESVEAVKYLRSQKHLGKIVIVFE